MVVAGSDILYSIYLAVPMKGGGKSVVRTSVFLSNSNQGSKPRQ